MKRWLNLTLALALFATGLTLGRLGVVPDSAEAQSTTPSTDLPTPPPEDFDDALAWEQIDGVLKMTVTGPDAYYLGVADRADPSIWSELGAEEDEILYGFGTLALDLNGVEDMTFYRLEPVGTLQDHVFRPCNDPFVECFPIHPPVDPPQPDFRVQISLTAENQISKPLPGNETSDPFGP